MSGVRIITSAVADADPDLSLIPGTVTRPCADCGRPCYIAPSSVPVADAGGLVTCNPCAQRLLATDPNVAFGILPDALDELAAWDRRGKTNL